LYDIYGEVNVVTPEPVHSTDVLQYVARLNRAWIKSGRALFGDEEATRLSGKPHQKPRCGHACGSNGLPNLRTQIAQPIK